MQEIHVQAFGRLTDLLGKEALTLSEVHDTQSLVARLEADYPALAGQTYRLAVNNRLISAVVKLENKDIIALLPPFSGG